MIFTHGPGFTLSNVQKEVPAGLLLVGAMGGALVAGTLADRMGRRRTSMGTAGRFILGVLLAAA